MYRLKIASILGRNLAFVNGVGTPQKVASGIQHAIRLFGNQSLDSDAGIRVVDSLERHLKADPREIFLSPI